MDGSLSSLLIQLLLLLPNTLDLPSTQLIHALYLALMFHPIYIHTDPDSVSNVYKITDKIGAVMTGLVTDSRAQVRKEEECVNLPSFLGKRDQTEREELDKVDRSCLCLYYLLPGFVPSHDDQIKPNHLKIISNMHIWKYNK